MNIPYAHNPILPPDTFVPDVEAHVWEDGRLYLYGSLDIEGREGYCSDRYHVYSTDDLVRWVDHGVSFAVSDIGRLGGVQGIDPTVLMDDDGQAAMEAFSFEVSPTAP